MLTQKRKRTDLNQARKQILLSLHNASDRQVNKFLHACLADKREKIFVELPRVFRVFGIGRQKSKKYSFAVCKPLSRIL